MSLESISQLARAIAVSTWQCLYRDLLHDFRLPSQD